MCNGPARSAADKAQPLLPVEPVDLVDDTINIIAKARPLALEIPVGSDQSIDTFGPRHQRVHIESPLRKEGDGIGLGFGKGRARGGPCIGEELQRARLGDLDVELAQATCGRIARIGKHFAARLGLAGIERRKIGVGHVDLAADLDAVRPALPGKKDRHIIQRAGIRGNVLADLPVPARGSPNKLALLIGQAQR